MVLHNFLSLEKRQTVTRIPTVLNLWKLGIDAPTNIQNQTKNTSQTVKTWKETNNTKTKPLENG